MLFSHPRDELAYWLSPSKEPQNSRLKVDLRRYGFSTAKPWKKSPFRNAGLNREYHEVAFGGSERIFATIASSPNPDARHLQTLTAVFLDAHSGRILGIGKWDAVYYKLGLLPTPSGNFVVRVADELRLYTVDLMLLGEFALPLSRRPGTEYWQAFLTPSGKSLVLVHGLDKSLEFEWLDPDTLKLKQIWKAPDGMFYQTRHEYAPLDDGILVTLRDLRVGSCEIDFVDFESAWTTSYRRQTPCESSAQAVDNMTFCLRVRNELLLIRRDGSILFRQSIDKGDFADGIRPSADGNMVAIAIDVQKGGNELFDVNSHQVLKRIQVCDLLSGQMVFALDSKRIDLQGVSDFNLSPDGSELVLLRGGVVEGYGGWPMLPRD